VNDLETVPESEATETTQRKKKGNATHRALTVVGILLCVLLVPILVLNITLIVKSYTEPDKVPSIFGTLPMLVSDDSMEPDIMKGDLVLAQSVDPSEIKEGDVILFFDTNKNNQGKVLTQRVAKIVVSTGGLISWETERIGTPAEGEQNKNTTFTVPAKNLVGRWEGTRIPFVGSVALFMQTIPGVLLCVVLPVILLVLYDFLRERKEEKKKAGETAALMAELEALRALQNAPANSATDDPLTEEPPVVEPPTEEPPTEEPPVVEPPTEEPPTEEPPTEEPPMDETPTDESPTDLT